LSNIDGLLLDCFSTISRKYFSAALNPFLIAFLGSNGNEGSRITFVTWLQDLQINEDYLSESQRKMHLHDHQTHQRMHI
jgi:hypothetical protein